MKNTTNIVDAPIHDEESDYQFSEGSYFSIQFKIVGIAFIIMGISYIFRLNLLGIILLLLGLIIMFAKKNLTISFTLSKYRNAFSLLNFRLGKWETLPDFESISVFTAKKSQNMAAGSQSQTAFYSEIEVNLVYNRSRRLTVFTTKNYDKAFEIARLFADKFKLSIYDATQREGKWID